MNASRYLDLVAAGFVAGLIRAGLTGGAATLGSAAMGAEPPAPLLVQDFARDCAPGKAPDLAAWRVSGGLERALWPTRLTCVADGNGATAALRIEVRPGDAYDPNPGDNPTERVELQARRELVEFERPVWYSFRFRLTAPWVAVENRTVIHQIKQNIAPENEIEHGGVCPSANPLFKIEAGHRTAIGGPGFVVKVRGTDNCLDGKSGEPICGPWKLTVGQWYRVNVALLASQRAGESDVRVWLDGEACPSFTGRLGYLDHGKRDAAGRPTIDAQPRFGIYRDALADPIQAIEIADIAFWDVKPAGHPSWAAIDLPPTR